jgi:branched-chain amino acid aminotransferase
MVFAVRDSALVVAGGHLPEATGYHVATLASEMGIAVVERTIQIADLIAAPEVFLAGTSCGVIGIARIDEHPIGEGGEGPITRRLRERYRASTRDDR